MRALIPTLGVVCTAVGVAACGGSGPAGSAPATETASSQMSTAAALTTATRTATASSPAPTQTSAEGTATGSSGGVAVGGGAAPCRAAGLSLTFLGEQGATGHGELGFALRNTTGASCQTVGYPGVQFLDGSGAPLPTVPSHAIQDFFGTTRLTTVALGAGQAGSFRLAVGHESTSGAGCTTAYGLQVIPPNDTATLRVSLPGGAAECAAVTVSPVQPGDLAYHS